MSSTCTVLIVEDDSFLAETIAVSLADHGVKTRIALDGGMALQSIAEVTPDLVLLDLLMPKMDGTAVLKHLQEKGISLPIIILSNLSDDLSKESCLRMGALDYFIKSDMDEDELWPMVQRYLPAA